jgi:hypothetical protein
MSEQDEVVDLFPPIKPHIVPPSEWNPRGGATASGYVARTLPYPAEPQAPNAAHTATIPASARVIPPAPEDPRVQQVRDDMADASRRAVASQPQRYQAPVEPSTAQPRSPADYFRQEVAPQIIDGQVKAPNRGY